MNTNKQIKVVNVNTAVILNANSEYRNSTDKVIWGKKVFTELEARQGLYRSMWKLTDDGNSWSKSRDD